MISEIVGNENAKIVFDAISEISYRTEVVISDSTEPSWGMSAVGWKAFVVFFEPHVLTPPALT